MKSKGDNLKFFIGTFLTVLVINQSFYGFCMKPHCLIAALPLTLIISGLITFFYFKSQKEDIEHYGDKI